jgi:hypothetical protein
MWQPHKQFGITFLTLLLAYAGIQFSAGQNLIANGGFEGGIKSWNLWVPAESQGANCRFDVVSDSPHSGTNCARLQSDDYGRFAIGTDPFPAQPGEHYRVTAWVRADPAALARVNTHGVAPSAGFVIRLHLSQDKVETQGGHFFIGLGNVVTRGAPAALTTALPKDWTKVEAVVEIPPGVDSVNPSLFSWWVTGTIFIDDFSIEKVDASTPITPLPASDPGSSSAPNPENK